MILFLVLACRPDPPLGPPSPASWVETGSAVGAEVIGATGNRAASVRVRSFNAFGGSTLGSDVTVDVDGVDMDVDIGAQGYGEIVLDEPGTYTLQLGVSESTAWVYGSDWPGFGLMRGFVPPMQTTHDAMGAGTGVLTFEEGALWWTGPGMPSHRVLVSDADISGMAAGHYDGDGLLDAAVWAGQSVHFLRGRSGGGMTYAGHLRSPTHTVAGVDFGDATNDGIPDLAIAWVGPPLAGLLDIWESDGLLGFDSAPNRRLTNIPFDVAIGDNTGEGKTQITLTLDGGGWDRYFQAPQGYAPLGPALELDFLQFTRVYSPGDFNRDGADDLLFVPPFNAGAERRVVMYDLNGDVPTFTGITRQDAYVAVDDLDDDGLYDMLFCEGGGDLIGVHANPDGEGLETDTLFRGLPDGAPVARPPGTRRILYAGTEDWLWIEGQSTPDEWLVTRDPLLVAPGLTVRDGVFEVLELDGDPSAPELVSLRAGPGSMRLRVWTIGTAGVAQLGDVELDPVEKIQQDLAICGTDAYVLLEDALYRVDISDPTSLSVSGTLPIVGRAVACGNGPAGPLSVLTDAGALLFDAGFTQVGITPASGSVDLWLDDTGTSTCDRPGCRILRGPVGPSGDVVDVVGWPTGAEIDGEPVFGRGAPTVADIDGNGHADVLFHAAGRLVVYRHTGETLGPPEIFHTRLPFAGPLAIADFDDDGFNDAWGVEPADFRLRITPSGTAPPPDPVPTDTSDTGSMGTTGDTGVN